MAKARIVVDGVVQGVGYRALVKQIAEQLGLKGLVRNLEGTKVEIFCEGVPDRIEEFLKRIDRKAKPNDFLSINVWRIECFFEGQDGYEAAWREYKGFEIDYELEGRSASEKAMLEDYEFKRLHFVAFRNELRDFRRDTNENFRRMIEKCRDALGKLKESRKMAQGFHEAFLAECQKRTPNP